MNLQLAALSVYLLLCCHELLKWFHRFPAINQPWQPPHAATKANQMLKSAVKLWLSHTVRLHQSFLWLPFRRRRRHGETRPNAGQISVRRHTSLPQFTLVLFTLCRRGLSAEEPELTVAGTEIQAVSQRTHQPVYEEHLGTTWSSETEQCRTEPTTVPHQSTAIKGPNNPELPLVAPEVKPLPLYVLSVNSPQI